MEDIHRIGSVLPRVIRDSEILLALLLKKAFHISLFLDTTTALLPVKTTSTTILRYFVSYYLSNSVT